MSRYIILLFSLLAAIEASATEDTNSEILIIGGGEVPVNFAAHTASLRTLSNLHFCGGTIISVNHILTSAQCTNGRAVNSINVVVGTIHRDSGGVTYRSTGIVNHPMFNHETLENDIALVITPTIVTNLQIRTTYIRSDLFLDDQDVTMFGWGITSKDVIDPKNLYSKMSKTISNEECRLQLQNSTSQNAWRISERKICTSVHQDIGICYGDEGGALFNSGLAVIGVASWHLNCRTDLPNVYERIAPHRLWIESHTQ